MNRIIRVLRPAGGKVVSFEAPNNLTWETLEPLLIENSISTQRVHVIVSGSNVAVNALPTSKVPDGDIMLGIKQTKLPFGASYTEMRDLLKNRRATALAENDQKTLDLIGNYTQKNLDQLTDVYNTLVATTVNVNTVTVSESLEPRVARLEREFIALSEKVNGNTATPVAPSVEEASVGFTAEELAFLEELS